jgi:hypothetical protein
VLDLMKYTGFQPVLSRRVIVAARTSTAEGDSAATC